MQEDFTMISLSGSSKGSPQAYSQHILTFPSVIMTVADPGLPRRGGAVPTYYLQFTSRQLHENERNWTQTPPHPPFANEWYQNLLFVAGTGARETKFVVNVIISTEDINSHFRKSFCGAQCNNHYLMEWSFSVVNNYLCEDNSAL